MGNGKKLGVKDKKMEKMKKIKRKGGNIVIENLF
jgi:hypothetical protein